MAYIKINTQHQLYDGAPITFRAPCDCTAVEGVSVNSKNFVFKDAHGEALTGIGNLFLKDAVVKVILDVTNGCAYIQNADTNSYLENKDVDCIVDQYVTETKTIGQGSSTGSLSWYVREWKSGRVECFGELEVSNMPMVASGYGDGVYGITPANQGVFSQLELPVALDVTPTPIIIATMSNRGNPHAVFSVGRRITGYINSDSGIKQALTVTPMVSIWSPVQQDLAEIRVEFFVSGQKA